MSVVARSHIFGAGLDRGIQHGVGTRHLGVELHHADVIEHERHRAGLGQMAAMLGEGGAHLAGGAVAVVGQHLDNDRDAAGTVTFVADFVIAFGVAALRLLDGAIDIVLRHVLGARCKHSCAQPRVHRGVRQAKLGGHRDFARELAEQLGLRFVRPPLAVHDVLELGMAGHGFRLASSMVGPARANRALGEPGQMQ